MDEAALKAEAREAFRHVQKPGVRQMTPHRCEDCYELRDDLHRYDFDNIPSEVLDRHLWDLPLLSDDAKQYYLPAWIIRSIEEPDSDYTPALLYALESDHRWAPTIAYTERQWAVVAAWLEFLEPRVDEVDLEHVMNAKKRLNGEP